jgi:MFS family permease
MKSIINKFYLASTVSTFGNWLTSIGLSILVYERFGAESLALTGLFMTLPQFFLNKKVFQKIGRFDQRGVLVFINILCAVNVAVLGFATTLPMIYAYFFVSALLKTLHNSVSRSWLADLAGDDSAGVFKRLSGLTGLMLAVSPSIGALIASKYGFQPVFILDALSFLAAAGIYGCLPQRRTHWQTQRLDKKPPFSKCDENLTLSLEAWAVISLWIVFFGIGTVHTAIDISYFKSIHIGDGKIGYLLSAWGFGSFIAFLFRKEFFATRSLVFAASIFGLGLVVIFNSQNIFVITSSLVTCGYFYSCIVGLVRKEIQDLTIHRPSLSLWGRVEVLSSIASSVLSLIVAFSIARFSLTVAINLLVIIATFFTLYCLVYVNRFKRGQ